MFATCIPRHPRGLSSEKLHNQLLSNRQMTLLRYLNTATTSNPRKNPMHCLWKWAWWSLKSELEWLVPFQMNIKRTEVFPSPSFRLGTTLTWDPVNVFLFLWLKAGSHPSCQAGNTSAACTGVSIYALIILEAWPQGSHLSPQLDMKPGLFILSVCSIRISWSIGNKCPIHAVIGSNKFVEHEEPAHTTGNLRY